jgi:hypothetical protein
MEPEDPDAKFNKFLNERHARQAEIDEIAARSRVRASNALKELEKERAELPAAQERRHRCISDLDKLRIGMTETETRPITKCIPLIGVNTTQTTGGVRKQVVLHMDETWTVGYLYFEDGRLAAIQRRE